MSEQSLTRYQRNVVIISGNTVFEMANKGINRIRNVINIDKTKYLQFYFISAGTMSIVKML
jgi:hypothetical protein